METPQPELLIGQIAIRIPFLQLPELSILDTLYSRNPADDICAALNGARLSLSVSNAVKQLSAATWQRCRGLGRSIHCRPI